MPQRWVLYSPAVAATLLISLGCERVPDPVGLPLPDKPLSGKCFLDPECGGGMRDAGSGLCTQREACLELWMCPSGPQNGDCPGAGGVNCAYSPGCLGATGTVVQSCRTGECIGDVASCAPRIKIEPYHFNPNPNQCDCNDLDPTHLPGAAVQECGLQVKCFVDPSCAGSFIRRADNNECASSKEACSELWKCREGPTLGTCGGGTKECAYSPGCFSVTHFPAQGCFVSGCANARECNDLLRIREGSCPL